MKQYTIEIRDNYQIPSSLNKITAEEWEIALSWMGELLLKHETITSKLNDAQIKLEIEQRYQNTLTKLDNKLKDKDAECKELLNKITTIENKRRADVDTELQQRETQHNHLKETIAAAHRNAILEKEAEIAEYKLQKKNALAEANAEAKERYASIEVMYRKQIDELLQQSSRVAVSMREESARVVSVAVSSAIEKERLMYGELEKTKKGIYVETYVISSHLHTFLF
jgi:hypothetical protein